MFSDEIFDVTATSLNGFFYDMTSVRLTMMGIRIGYQMKDISFSEKITPTVIKDAHPVRVGTGIGMHEADASITVQQEIWQQMAPRLMAMAAQAGAGAGQCLTVLQGQINIAFLAPGGLITTVDLLQVRIIGRSLDAIAGQEGLVRKIPLSVQQIIENGVPLAPFRR